MTINVVVYVLWLIVFINIDVTRALVTNHLALNPELPGILLEPWQLITYNFLHLRPGFWGLIHIGFNMLWLYWIGKEYEEMHGSHRLFSAYIFGGLGGGILTVILHALFPSVGAFGGIVHGASASVLGVITTVAILYPYKSVGLLLIGAVRLIYLVIGYLALNLLFISGGDMSVSAHLGGALFGYLLAKSESRGIDLSAWAAIFFRGKSRRRQTYTPYKPYAGPKEGVVEKVSGWFSSKRSEERSKPAKIHQLRPAAEPKSEDASSGNEVDRILDKISETGYESLTDEEKRTLYEASRR